MLARYGFDGTNGDSPAPIWVKSGTGGSQTVDIQSKKLRLLSPATGGFASSARAILKQEFHDVEVLCRVTPGQTWATEAYFGINVIDDWNATNVDEGQNGWTFHIEGSSPSLNIWSNIGSVRTSILSVAHTFTASTAVWFRTRKRGNGLAMKAWNDGTREPAAWDSIGFDTAGANTGPWFVGLGINNGAAASAVRFDVDNLSIDDMTPIRVRPTFRRF